LVKKGVLVSKPLPLPELKERPQSGVFADYETSCLLSGNATCRRLLEALPTAVLLVDGEGQILLANAQAGALLEQPTEELETRNIAGVVAPLDKLFGMEQAKTSHRWVNADGAERYLGCRVSIAEQVHMSDSDPKYLVVFDDETSWKRLLSERDRLLRLAAMGGVLPAVLHELKNPLAAVTLLVEVLLEESAEGSLRSDLHAILGELRRLHLTLDGVGTMGAKLPSDRFQAVDQAIEETCVIMSRTAVAGGVELVCEVPPMPLLALEASVIRAIMFNLVQNAIQACRQGDKVTVRGQLEDGWLEFSVADTGRGMPPEVLARCRDLFFTTKVRGSGIGLSLCHQICREAGGEMRIESEPGKGTTITARVPVQRRLSPRPSSMVPKMP
jgi:signal transduction histidine kinase